MKQTLNSDNSKCLDISPVYQENKELQQSFLKLIFCDNKVYFPTMAIGENNHFLMTNPVHCEDIEEPSILDRIEKERKTRVRVLSEDQVAELSVNSQRLLLDTTGFSNTSVFDSFSACYTIFWDHIQEKVFLFLNEPDLTKPSRKLEFEYDIDLIVLVTTILKDLEKYPKVFKEKDPTAISNIPKSSISVFSQAIKKSNESPRDKSLTKITVTKLTKETKESKKSRTALILIKNGKAFLPTYAKDFNNSVGFWVDPVHVCQLDADQLVQIVSKVLNQDAVAISTDEGRTMVALEKKGKSPLLLATKSTSWRNLENTSLSYSIQLIDSGTKWMLSLHSPKKGDSKDIYFQIGTPIKELVKLILQDSQIYNKSPMIE
jgi:hypothetical protein